MACLAQVDGSPRKRLQKWAQSDGRVSGMIYGGRIRPLCRFMEKKTCQKMLVEDDFNKPLIA